MSSPTPSLQRVRFLLVEDSPHMVQIIREILRGLGAVTIHDARDGAAAMALLQLEPVDIILLDVNLAGEDGLEFLRRLRGKALAPLRYLPVIVLTAHTERSLVFAARDAGATEFCQKPITVSELLRKLAAVIDAPREFVQAERYSGPDRRRRSVPDHHPERRRT